MRHLVIVARDRPELFENLTRRLPSSPSLQVVMDRRHTAPATARTPERRGTDEDAPALWVQGFIIVRAGE
ncbi:MAG: hypothetical protein HYU41_12635 [Candidatus Rokubacteria bacterium]|nr:hypothetical protein [Candidatus Rokubacteria bacterium]